MKKVVWVVVALCVATGAFASLYMLQPERLTPERLAQAVQAQERLAAAAPAPAAAPAQPKAESKAAEKAATPPPAAQGSTAPEVFKVKFECSNGEFVIECRREWAPLGTDRFYDLVQQGFYNECRFFRVLKDFVVQFGISGDPAVSMKWYDKNIKDDPRKQSNTEGTVTFAKSGMPNSRTTQLFISLVDNTQRLDGQGFAPFGKVISGMDTVKKINMEYTDRPDQGQIQQQGNAFLQKNFPNLDYVKKASIVTDAAG